MRPSPSAEPGDPPPPRPRLRQVVGGYDITRLPIHLVPVSGEHPASWLWRWAHRYGTPVNQMLTHLGIPPVGGTLDAIAAHVSDHRAALTRATGLTEIPVPGLDDPGAAAMTEQLFRYLAIYRRVTHRPSNGIRFCPRCLSDDAGAWRTAWASPLQLICARHGRVLARVCPRCERPPFTGSVIGADCPPWTCALPSRADHLHRRHYRRCGYDLRETETTAATDEQVNAQARLGSLAVDATTGPQQPVTRCGFSATNRDVLDAVFELLVEHLPDGAHLHRISSTDPGDVLDGIGAAFQVLGQADADTAAATATAAGLLHPHGTVTPIGPDQVLGRRPRNPLLAAIRLGSLRTQLPPVRQLMFRVASDRPRYPTVGFLPTATPDGTPDGTLMRWIPQQLWLNVLIPWIENDDYRARAAAAMLLAKVGSTRPWPVIAFDLGLPVEFASYPSTLVRRLKHDNTRWDFLGALDDLATRLQAGPPPIDYKERRWAAAMPADLAVAVSQARDILGDQAPWASIYLLVELFWQVYTGGDLRLAAPPAGVPDPDRYPGHLAARDQLGAADRTPLFTLAAEILAVSTHQTSSPLTGSLLDYPAG